MDHVVYILYSAKYNKTYVGRTSNLIGRMRSHNFLATKGWTVKYRPWMVAHLEFYKTLKEASQREKWYKSGQGRETRKLVVARFTKYNQ